jgi:oligopeptide/dipeptide ABC transporter ATP-binding protein
LFIGHNFGVISEMTDRVMVMYAGRVVEEGPTQDVLASPAHPYTAALMRTVPDLGRRVDRLPVIDGAVPHPARLPAGCAFQDRCVERQAGCRQLDPALAPLTGPGPGSIRRAACIHACTQR